MSVTNISPADMTAELVKSSAAFTGKDNVRVVVGGSKAHYDMRTKTLYYPEIKKEITPSEAAVSRGYVDHECGHEQFTDRTAWANAIESKGSIKGYKEALNAFDDFQVDSNVIARRPGTKYNLEALEDALLDKNIESVEKAAAIGATIAATPDNLESISSIANLVARYNHLFDTKREKLDALVGALPEDTRKLVDNYSKSLVNHTKSTADAATLAATLAEELKALADEQEQEEPEQDDGEGEAKLPPTSSDEDAEQEGEGEPVAKQGEPDPSVKGTFDRDTENVIKEIAGSELKVTSSAFPWPSIHPSMDVTLRVGEKSPLNTTEFNKFCNKERMLKEGGTYYNQLMNNIPASTAHAKALFERAFFAERNRSWDARKDFGRFDTRLAVAAMGGDPNVYLRRSKRPEAHTAVTIMVDASGSMEGSKWETALQAAGIISDALRNSLVSVRIVAFSNHCCISLDYNKQNNERILRDILKVEDSVAQQAMLDELRDLGRQGRRSWGNVIWEIKGWNSVMSDVGRYIGHAYNSIDLRSNNADGKMVWDCYLDLQKRPEPRKILMVLSDGAPCSNGGGKEKEELKEATRRIEAAGDVSLIGIGFYSTAVKLYYQNHVLVNSDEALSKTMLAQLSTLLTQEGKR